MMRKKTFQNYLLLASALIMLALPVTGIAQTKVINQVYVSSETINVTNNDTVIITYSAEKPAKTAITIWNSAFTPVRQFNNQTTKTGLNSLVWDGTDQNSHLVPDDAYFITIDSQINPNSNAIYDPTLSSGGVPLAIPPQPESFNTQTGLILFALPAKAMVRVRAGIENGPIYATIIDWQKLPSGRHEIFWDGMSDDKIVNVANNPDLFITVEAYTLPDNSIIIQNSPSAEKDYSAPPLQTSIDPLFPPRQFKLISTKMGISLPFSLKINNQPLPTTGTIAISDLLNINVEADPQTMAILSQNRFEVVVFVDNKRFDEVEYAYLPLTYRINTANIIAGDHLITLNMFTITGQRTARSARITLQKK